jgi:RHS repeat-associated protein
MFNLINMGGRVYDPEIARFISPDPIIQDPFNIISYNRYTYCLNNPLKYVDPSGYLAIKTRADFWNVVDNLWNSTSGGS